MKTYMPLNGLRWSRNSGSANCDMPQSAVFGRPGGVNKLIMRKISHKIGFQFPDCKIDFGIKYFTGEVL